LGFLSYEVTVKQAPGLLRVTAAGTVNVWRTKRLIDRIAAEARQHAARKVLLDLRGLAGRLSISARISIGEYVAARVPVKLAVVLDPEMANYVAEWIARERGADLRAFIDEAYATTWLRQAESTSSLQG
jgi:hypothetical protein